MWRYLSLYYYPFFPSFAEKWQVWKVHEAWKRERRGRGAIFQFASRKKKTSTKVSCVCKSFRGGCTLPRKAAKREVYFAKLSRGPPRVHAEYANNIIFLTFLSLNSLPSPFPGENTDKFLFSRAARLLSVGTLSSVIIKLLLRFYYIACTIVEDEKLNNCRQVLFAE